MQISRILFTFVNLSNVVKKMLLKTDHQSEAKALDLMTGGFFIDCIVKRAYLSESVISRFPSGKTSYLEMQYKSALI